MRYIVLIWTVWTVCFTGVTCLSTPAALAESANVRGTRVQMEVPEGFKPAANFSGYGNEALSASVMVTEMPIPFEAATAGFNQAGLESKGMKLISKEAVTSGPYNGFIVEVKQNAYGVDFDKWINVFGDQSMTVIVTATYPVSQSEVLSKKLKDVVLSARFDATAKVNDPMEDLPFTVSGTTSLKIAGRVQNTLLLTPSGKMTAPADAVDKSVFVVGQALSDMEIGDKNSFARARLEKTENLTDIKVLEEKDTTVSGMPAREILASAKGKKGEPLFILQTIAFGRGSYFIMQGLTDMTRKTRMEYEFRSVINSLKLKAAAS
ncbi:MAG: hypothetical protein EKK48_11150 [Candidatus Melainabacteria bacterium]|nr:MAG: hypothetical protein EKK48_11150 [Candidatus Melainabacteria bacterium]